VVPGTVVDGGFLRRGHSHAPKLLPPSPGDPEGMPEGSLGTEGVQRRPLFYSSRILEGVRRCGTKEHLGEYKDIK